MWRHPCECPTASRPLNPGEEPEHRFDVDGSPFPWLIAEAGATFTKRDELHLVTVRLFPMASASHEHLKVILDDSHGDPLAFEYVDGQRRPFPWAILDDALAVEFEHGYPVVVLTFLAERVDADIEIPEEFAP